MDQYIGSNKLATYLHPNSSDPFSEIKTESIKSPSPDLIDIREFNSYYQQLVETSSSSSSSNISSHKPFVSSSDFEENDCKTNLSTPISSPKIKHFIQENSSFDQCISSDYPKIILNKQEHLLACHQNDDDDITSTYKLSSKEKKLYRFFFLNIILDFIIKIEQIPNIWAINPTNGRSIKENDDNKKV
jgi:hypothetical protein